MNRNKLALLAVSTVFVLAAHGQNPVYRIPDSASVLQPTGTATYEVLSSVPSVTGDFNGDGKGDLAYIEDATTGTGDNFLVVLVGQPNGIPSQTGTDLGSCFANSLAAADVNSDGHLDLVILCSQGSVATLFGKGDGTFNSPVITTLPAFATAIALKDLNRDGLPDLAAITPTGYLVGINKGNGTFSLVSSALPSGAYPTGIAIGDVNGDGNQDLVFGPGYVFGQGNGTFGAYQAVSAGISGFTLADVNGDGYDDLIFSPAYSAQSKSVFPLSVISGGANGLSSQSTPITGDGFGNATLKIIPGFNSGKLRILALVGSRAACLISTTNYPLLSQPLCYASSGLGYFDTNLDGIPDLVGMDTNSASVPILTLLPGAENSEFGAPLLSFGAGLEIVTDANADGLADVITAGADNRSPQVLLSTGDGRFNLAPPSAVPDSVLAGNFVASADFDGDGKQDFATIYAGCDFMCGSQSHSAQVSVFRGMGDGTLAYLNSSTLQVSGVFGVTPGDFDGDGKQDLILIYQQSGSGGTFTGGGAFVHGNGDGSFSNLKLVPLLSQTPQFVAAFDVNGDKRLDLVVLENGGMLTTYLGNGDGTFAAAAGSLQVPAGSKIAIGDVNMDGIPDVVCYEANGHLKAYAGNGDGSFATAPTFSGDLWYLSDFPQLNSLPGFVQMGDLNGDGLPDIAVAYTDNSNSGRVEVFLNQGSGNFSHDPNSYYVGQGTLSALALARVNRASFSSNHGQALDLLAAPAASGYTASLATLLNLKGGVPAPVPAMTLSVRGGADVTAGQNITVEASLDPEFGSGTVSGKVIFSLNHQGSVTADVVSNRATAEIQVRGSGTLPLSATYSGDSENQPANAFLSLLSSAIGTTTTLSVGAQTAAQGTNLSVTAQVAPADAGGTITLSDNNESLSTQTLDAQGVARFSLSNLSVGSHSLMAMYGGDSNHASSASPAVPVTITASSVQLAATPTNLVIRQGSTGSTTINVTPVGMYAGSVSLTCGGLPANTSCTFSPSSVNFSGASNQGPQAMVLTISTNVQAPPTVASKMDSSHKASKSVGGGYSLALLPFVWFLYRRRGQKLRTLASFLMATCVVWALGACGGQVHIAAPLTPVGTSAVKISAVSAGAPLDLTITITQ